MRTPKTPKPTSKVELLLLAKQEALKASEAAQLAQKQVEETQRSAQALLSEVKQEVRANYADLPLWAIVSNNSGALVVSPGFTLNGAMEIAADNDVIVLLAVSSTGEEPNAV